MTINITFYYFLLSLQNILGCGLVDRIGAYEHAGTARDCNFKCLFAEESKYMIL